MACVSPYVSDGPLWLDESLIEAEYCRTNWLVGVLMISNINPEKIVSVYYSGREIRSEQ